MCARWCGMKRHGPKIIELSLSLCATRKRLNLNRGWLTRRCCSSGLMIIYFAGPYTLSYMRACGPISEKRRAFSSSAASASLTHADAPPCARVCADNNSKSSVASPIAAIDLWVTRTGSFNYSFITTLYIHFWALADAERARRTHPLCVCSHDLLCNCVCAVLVKFFGEIWICGFSHTTLMMRRGAKYINAINADHYTTTRWKL